MQYKNEIFLITLKSVSFHNIFFQNYIKITKLLRSFHMIFSPKNPLPNIFPSHPQNSELMDKLTASETEAAELKNLVDDLEYELDSAKTRVTKLDCHLSDAMQKLKTFQEGEITVQGGGEGVSKNKVSVIKGSFGVVSCVYYYWKHL